MIKRFKDWLMLTFLPEWAKARVYEQNSALKKENAELHAKIRELNAYIDGLEAGIRAQRRIIINNKAEGK